MKPSVASGILIDSLGRILLIKRKYDKKEFPNYWACPGGKVDPGETVEEAAIREVREEVGLVFTLEKLYREQETDINIFYRFLGKYTGSVVLQEEECDGYGWFHYEETRELLIYERLQEVLMDLKSDGLLL